MISRDCVKKTWWPIGNRTLPLILYRTWVNVKQTRVTRVHLYYTVMFLQKKNVKMYSTNFVTANWHARRSKIRQIRNRFYVVSAIIWRSLPFKEEFSNVKQVRGPLFMSKATPRMTNRHTFLVTLPFKTGVLKVV